MCSLRAEKCKVMDSKMRPIWLVFQNQDTLGEDILQIFKSGDGEAEGGGSWKDGGRVERSLWETVVARL